MVRVRSHGKLGSSVAFGSHCIIGRRTRAKVVGNPVAFVDYSDAHQRLTITVPVDQRGVRADGTNSRLRLSPNVRHCTEQVCRRS